MILTLESQSEWVGTRPFCLLGSHTRLPTQSHSPPVISPAVPHPHSCDLAPHSFAPGTAGWAAAVGPSLLGWLMCPWHTPGPGAQRLLCSFSLSDLPPTPWDPAGDPNAEQTSQCCVWSGPLGGGGIARMCFKELHLSLSIGSDWGLRIAFSGLMDRH